MKSTNETYKKTHVKYCKTVLKIIKNGGLIICFNIQFVYYIICLLYNLFNIQFVYWLTYTIYLTIRFYST